MGELFGCLHGWSTVHGRRNEWAEGAHHEGLAKTSVDALYSTQGGAGRETDEPGTEHRVDRCYQHGRLHQDQTSESTTVLGPVRSDGSATLSKARWLSRGRVLSRALELQEEMYVVLEEERMEELAVKFKDERFLMKWAYERR